MSGIDNKQIYTDLGLNKPQPAKDSSKSKLGQEEFLKLMTAQLKFQDPLKPMQNGDFIAQMAQFGTVSGIGDLNKTFSSMSASFQSNQALQASTMVGRKVLAPGEQFSLQAGQDAQMAVDLTQPAGKVLVNITDSNGQLLHRIDMGSQSAGLVNVQWNGLDDNGNRVAPGIYHVAAEIHQGEEIAAGNTLIAAQVESVTLGKTGQDLTLTVSGLGDIGMSQIRKIM